MALNEVTLYDKRTGRRFRIRGAASEQKLKDMLIQRMLVEHLELAVRYYPGTPERKIPLL